MAIGDQADVLNRINAVLPPWFGADETPVLDGVLTAYSWVGSFTYSNIYYTQLQMRITTATDENLDLIAADYFGPTGLTRLVGEGDTSYRNRILATILEERATRRGMINVLTNLTGTPPKIIVPQRAADCGGYNVGGVGYNVAGSWSNPNLAYQCFITVYTPVVSTIANLAGWGVPTGAWGTPSYIAWSNRNASINALQANQIYQAINTTKCEGTVCWVTFVNA